MAKKRKRSVFGAEWNFRAVPAHQERDCLIWELARESATMKRKIKARFKSGGSYAQQSATEIKFRAETFCWRFQYFMKYFPHTPWRKIPATRAKGKPSDKHLSDLMVNFEDQRSFAVMQEGRNADGFKALGSIEQFLNLGKTPHIVASRTLVNLSYTDNAIRNEFNRWLANEREKRGIPEGLVAVPGKLAQEKSGRKDKTRTDLNRLTVMRLMHVKSLEDAIKTENKAAEKAGMEPFYGEHSETDLWRQARLMCRDLLHEYFSEVEPGENPLRFTRFSE